MDPEDPAKDPAKDPARDHAQGQPLFSSQELTRIYREEAAAAAATGRRLTVLLAPYGLVEASAARPGHED